MADWVGQGFLTALEPDFRPGIHARLYCVEGDRTRASTLDWVFVANKDMISDRWHAL